MNTPAELADRLTGLKDTAGDAVEAALDRAMQDLAASIAANELSGQVLNARTGALRASLEGATLRDGVQSSGTVSAGTPYAAIHEYGGIINRFSRAQAGRRTLRPGKGEYRIVEPEQAYLRPAQDAASDTVIAQLATAVTEVFNA